MEPFHHEWKGAEVTFTWIQIAISISGLQAAGYEVGFQPGKKHEGTVPSSPHPHVDDSGLCEGAAGVGLNRARGAWNIIGLYALLHAVLVTPHYGGHSYYSPEAFIKTKGGRCGSCGWWYPIEILKKGKGCTSCSSLICRKCVGKQEKTPLFSPCTKCAAAKERELRKKKKEGEEAPGPLLLCKACVSRAGAPCYFCESFICRGSEGDSERGRVICDKHKKHCYYCRRLLCALCQTDYKCKECGKPGCSEHIEKDSGCCRTCMSKKKTSKKTKGDDNDVKVTSGVSTTTDF